jgi:ribosomal protein S18 acetylase RimI-like enzyme
MNTSSQHKKPPAPFVFRYEVRPEDRDIVRAIVASTGFFSPIEIEVAVELVDERLAKGASSGYHFVFADRAGQTLGYACYGPIALTAASYDLYWIAVDMKCQGQNIGKALLEESEKLIHTAGGGQIYIETSDRAQYASTRKFYLKWNYRQEALLKDFYAPGDDKVIYVKKV